PPKFGVREVRHGLTDSVFCCSRSIPRRGLVGRRPQLTLEERFGHLERTTNHPLASYIGVMQRRLDGESVDQRAEHESHLVGIGVTELTRPLPGSDHGRDLLTPPVVQSLTSFSRRGITKSAGPKLDPQGPVVLLG